MQADTNTLIIALGILVIMFVTIGLSRIFTDFWDNLLRRIKEWRNPEIQIKVERAVHKFDAGVFLYSTDLVFSNTTETETRIEDIKIFDKRKRELEFVTRGHTGPVTSFNIQGNDHQKWFIFCRQKQTGETTLVKLKACIYRTGKKKTCKKFESRLVSEGEFPTGEWFILPR